VYPPSDAVVQVRDSSFLLGSLGSGDARLTINGQPVHVWPNGAWLAYLPFPSESLAEFRLEARNATDSASLLYIVHRAVKETAPPPGARVWVDSLSLTPRGKVWVRREEYLPIAVRASEGAEVKLRLSDGTIVPLTPQPRRGEIPEGLRVFGGGAADSSWERDRYVGVLRGRAVGPDPGPVLPASGYVLPCGMPGDTSWATVEVIAGIDTARARWPLQVALLDTLPMVAELEDDTAQTGTADGTTVGRALPGGTYAWFFPTGTRAEVVGRVNGDLHLRLSGSAEAWIPAADALPLLGGTAPRAGVVGSVTLAPDSAFVRLRVPVSQRLPFRVLEGARWLAIRFYGAAGDVNWMRYGATDSLVHTMRWEQNAPDEVTLTLDLSRPVWGYRTRWDGNDLLLDVRRPPVLDPGHPLSGRLIAVDPGHPPGGATGPTGLREADANLAVSLELQRLLQAAGARVLMTRTSDSAVDLTPRVAMAERAGADVLVSIHNNALPDGVNPFTNNGSSVYYNHPRSVPLAGAIQSALVRRLGLRDLGIGRGDLALVRGTWMPSVLTEGLFMMLPDQESALRTPAGQRLYARAVLEGLRKFLDDLARDERR
jgi:N-acetylmuramoyl-L-alanine amidase